MLFERHIISIGLFPRLPLNPFTWLFPVPFHELLSLSSCSLFAHFRLYPFLARRPHHQFYEFFRSNHNSISASTHSLLGPLPYFVQNKVASNNQQNDDRHKATPVPNDFCTSPPIHIYLIHSESVWTTFQNTWISYFTQWTYKFPLWPRNISRRTFVHGTTPKTQRNVGQQLHVPKQWMAKSFTVFGASSRWLLNKRT